MSDSGYDRCARSTGVAANLGGSRRFPNSSLNDSSLTNGSNITISHEEVSLGGLLFGKSLLQICNTERVNVGAYSCYSENEAGRATFSFELLINTEGNNLCILGLLVSCPWS